MTKSCDKPWHKPMLRDIQAQLALEKYVNNHSRSSELLSARLEAGVTTLLHFVCDHKNARDLTVRVHAESGLTDEIDKGNLEKFAGTIGLRNNKLILTDNVDSITDE